ncbi:hypothetical protein [Enterococcus sp. CSURQ0835]|uniref:hypothetical protein n=1 Tax=Enterococcus sp. CSURQ0835 TaxID=2681394 RepID=UPI0013574232|nr:hypothetical protein [Enterococcus sp. CSURQ0835]
MMKKTMTMVGLLSGLVLFSACSGLNQQAATSVPAKQESKVPVTRKIEKTATTPSTSQSASSLTPNREAAPQNGVEVTAVRATQSSATAKTPTATPVTTTAAATASQVETTTVQNHEGGPVGEEATYPNDRNDLPATVTPENHEGGPAGEEATYPNGRSDLPATVTPENHEGGPAGEEATYPNGRSDLPATVTPENHEGGPAGEEATYPNDRSDLNQPVPADLLTAYRTTISQAGQDSASFSDEQLTQYFNEGVQYGDFGTLLQLVARDRGIPFQELLNNYYRYNGQNSDGSDAVLAESQLQAYRNVLSLAGLDSASFSDAQLNGYFHEAHLSGDFGTLLQLVARDRGLVADQLVATYLANSK